MDDLSRYWFSDRSHTQDAVAFLRFREHRRMLGMGELEPGILSDAEIDRALSLPIVHDDHWELSV